MGNTNVIFYYAASGWANAPLSTADSAAFQDAVHNMDARKNLTLVLHTLGGEVAAAKRMIQDLRSNFKYVSAIVPLQSMSAGTMIALACDKIIISKFGMLGPTDPQWALGNSLFSMKSIIAMYEQAQSEVQADPNARQHWADVLSPNGKRIYQKAKREYNDTAAFLEGLLMARIKDRAKVGKILNALYHGPQQHNQPIRHNGLKGLALNIALLEREPRLNYPVRRSLQCIAQISLAMQKPWLLAAVPAR